MWAGWHPPHHFNPWASQVGSHGGNSWIKLVFTHREFPVEQKSSSESAVF